MTKRINSPMGYKYAFVVISVIAFLFLSTATSLAEDYSKAYISKSWADPNPFSPDDDGSKDQTNFTYIIANEARITIKVIDYKGEIKTVVSNVYRAKGRHSEAWGGRNNNNQVIKNGNYTYVIKAANRAGDVLYRGGVSLNSPIPKLLTFSPTVNPFSPDGNNIKEKTYFHYSLDREARVSIKVFDYKGEVKTIGAEMYKIAGHHWDGWNGTNNSNKVLKNGNYAYQIKVRNSAGERTYSGGITLSSSPPVLSGVWSYANPFSPNGDKVKDSAALYFKIDKNSFVTSKVYNYKGEVKTIVSNLYQRMGRCSIKWDGKDNNNMTVENGTYKYVIYAENAGGVSSSSQLITVVGVSGKISIKIDKSDMRLYLYKGSALVKSYPIAIGRKGYPTPARTFTVVRKDINPTWYPPSWADEKYPVKYPASPLGPRRLLLSDRSYGIHGTLDPSAIGKRVTHGCIRLYNNDIKELYNIVPVGTVVKITE